MKIGFCGMGKLGFPCALAAASRGHDVVGYDVSPAAYDIHASRQYPHREVHAQELLEKTTLRMVLTVDALVEHADVVFVAVQTPHRPEFEGLNRMPEDRADFDYEALKESVHKIATAATHQQKLITVVVISTCLPMTCGREIKPLLNEFTGFVYNPFFIAMGTTIDDYLKPEFVLLGCDDPQSQHLARVRHFYHELHADPTFIEYPTGTVYPGHPPHAVMSVVSAELAKVFYNVFLGMKIVAANAGMEIAHKTGANIDDVTRAMVFATDRVASAKYMRGGMGDGGGCHPRDQIALSWLAEELHLYFDVGGMLIEAREKQTEWLADMAIEESREGKLPIVILGKAYKKGTNLTLGSPAILLRNILREYPNLDVTQWDPHVDGWDKDADSAPVICGLPDLSKPEEIVFSPKSAVYVIATDHDEFFKMKFPAGSTVIDPWGKMPDKETVKVVRIGRGA